MSHGIYAYFCHGFGVVNITTMIREYTHYI